MINKYLTPLQLLLDRRKIELDCNLRSDTYMTDNWLLVQQVLVAVVSFAVANSKITIEKDDIDKVRFSALINPKEFHQLRKSLEVISHKISYKSFGTKLICSLNFKETSEINKINITTRKLIKPWYAEIRKRLTGHFKSIAELEKTAFEIDLKHGEFLKAVNQYILEELSNECFSAKDLCKQFYFSPSQLNRRIKKLTLMSPGRYILFIRLTKAKSYLQDAPEITIGEVLVRVGIRSHSYFTKAFNEQFGFNPSMLKSENDKREQRIEKIELKV